MPEDSQALAAAFAARDPAELEARYAEWAATYDAENAALGYRNPQLCAAFLARHVAPGAGPVLDAGCGTGLVAETLAVLGYRDLVGLDLSEPMLVRARALGLYAELHRMALGGSLALPTGRFAAVVASGVFTAGHASPQSLDELVRVTRPSGHLVFNVRDDVWRERGFRDRQDALESEGRWRLVEMSDPYRPFTLSEPDLRARIFVYRVPGGSA